MVQLRRICPQHITAYYALVSFISTITGNGRKLTVATDTIRSNKYLSRSYGTVIGKRLYSIFKLFVMCEALVPINLEVR